MKARVLIVDDSATVRADLRGVLSAAGFATTLCENLTAARKTLHDGHDFDLVVLDMLLPDGEGVELLSELRHGPRTAQLPVMMLSTESAVTQRLRGLERGANDYVGKPYDPAYVVRRACELTQVSAAASDSHQALAGKRRRVMVVDGGLDFRHHAAEELRKDGHDVIVAGTGQDALRLLRVQPVDCLLLDLELPGLDALEWLRVARTQPGAAHMHVLGLTNKHDARQMTGGLAAKVDAFGTKSEGFEMLRAQVRHELRRRLEGEHPAPAPAPAPAPEPPPPATGTQSNAAYPVLFHEVVARSGLTSIIAVSTIARACNHVGVDAHHLTPKALQQALPSIRQTLRIFLDTSEAEQRMVAIQALAHPEPVGAHRH